MWEGINFVLSLSVGGGRDDITNEKLRKMSFKIVVGDEIEIATGKGNLNSICKNFKFTMKTFKDMKLLHGKIFT